MSLQAGAQAFRQDVVAPVVATPPFGALHFSGDPTIEQVFFPCFVVLQHATAPSGRLHVDFDAACRVTFLHCLRRRPATTAAFAASLTHDTYFALVANPSHGQLCPASSRTASIVA